MIKLTLNDRPVELTDEVCQQLTDKYKADKSPVWNEVYIRRALLEMTNNKCAYSEAPLDTHGNYWHIEHFRCKKKYEKKDDSVKYEYDPEKEKPIIRASICNGEQVAGFKNKETGEFHEIMIIRDQSELNEFMKTYGLDHVDKEY